MNLFKKLLFFNLCFTGLYANFHNSLNRYDKLSYNLIRRTKRSLSENNILTLTINSSQKNLTLKLMPNSDAFSEDFVLEVGNRNYPKSKFKDYFYEGYVEGDENSKVTGQIISGVFEGQIHLSNNESYYIEKANKYFEKMNGFHSILYNEKDVKSNRFKRGFHQRSHCGNDDSHKWMENIQKSYKNLDSVKHLLKTKQFNKYSEFLNKRKRRANSIEISTCTLYLRADPELHKKYYEMYGSKAEEEIMGMFNQHVMNLIQIFSNSKFDFGDSKISTKITFSVRRSKIFTDDDCKRNNSDTQNNWMCIKNIDVNNYLNYASLQNHDDYCLSYVFSFRDFSGGTLGLAWVANPANQAGGICEKYKNYPDRNGKDIMKSLNTGIVTLQNYRAFVQSKISVLTFAHEVGHNFGAQHDDTSPCEGQEFDTSKGNYVMFSKATEANEENNSKFSKCSLKSIGAVLTAVLNESGKKNCFVESDRAFCGNKIVERFGDIKEECDCGYKDDCNDKCCYARDENTSNRCKVKNGFGFVCSPTAGSCCNSDCQYENSSKICSVENECSYSSTCNGTSDNCPKPKPKKDLSLCNGNTEVCMNGICSGSVCQKIGWIQCYIQKPEKTPRNYNFSLLCFVACKKNPTSKCISSNDKDSLNKIENKEFKDLLNLTGEAITLKSGAPCDDLKGYCDVFQKCRSVDAEGPLSRLKKLLFSEETIANIRDWIVKKWWAVLLIVIGIFVFFGMFVTVCAVTTPSSNPKLKKAKSLTIRRNARHANIHSNQNPIPLRPSGGPPQGNRKNRAKESHSAGVRV